MSDEPQLLVRKFEATISDDGDGRTIEGLVIPYNVRQTVADPPDFQPYQEEILPGAFRGATKAPHRVLLDFEHYGATFDAVGSMGSIAGTLGWATELEETDRGLRGSFRVGKNPDGDKALELVNAGVLTGFSAAFKPLRSTRSENGVMQRIKAHLDRVSLCRVGAYEQAQVLAVRSKQVLEEMRPVSLDPALAQSLGRFVNMPEGVLLLRAFTEQPWDGSPARFASTADYCAACAIDDNPTGADKVQALCHLPFKEPNGDININAVRNALARVDQVQTTQESRDRARRMLERMLAEFDNRP